MTAPSASPNSGGERWTLEVGARELREVSGSGPLGVAPGWRRVSDVEAEDALVFTAVDVVPVQVPRITLQRHPWNEVHAGRWPDPTRSDTRFLDLAAEPYRRTDGEGWTVLRAASFGGRSLLERSWIFYETNGICLVRARFAAEQFSDMEVLLDSLVAEAPGIRPVGATHVIDYGPGGARAIPSLVEVSSAALQWMLGEAASDHPVGFAPPSDRRALHRAEMVDDDGALTANGRWWARSSLLANRHWTIRVERPAGPTQILTMSPAGHAVALSMRKGTTQWIGFVHRSRAPETAARFTGVAPAPHIESSLPVGIDTIRARLTAPETEPPAAAGAEFQQMWGDTWHRWILAEEHRSDPRTGRVREPLRRTSARQYIGTLHHGHYAVRDGSDLPKAGHPSRPIVLEPVPSTELFGLFCRDMLGPGHAADLALLQPGRD